MTSTKTLDQYIDEAKSNLGSRSYRQLSMAVGLDPSVIHSYRTNRAKPSEEAIIRIALAGGNDPEIALADLHLWTAKGAALSIWEGIARKIMATAAAIALLISVAVVGVAMPTPASAGNRA